MDWAADVAFVPRNALLFGLYSVALVAIGPVLGDRQWLLAPVLFGVAVLGTLLYVRDGLLVLTARCERCGECHHVGSVRCPRTGTARTAISHPIVQAVLAVALFAVVGIVADAIRTLTRWLASSDGPLHQSLLSGGGELYLAYFLTSATAAAVLVPILAGNLVRLSLRAAPSHATRVE